MASKFEQAFAANRKAGKKEFSFGGKKYNTKLKEETKKVPIPADKPKSTVDSGGPTKRYTNMSVSEEVLDKGPKQRFANKVTPTVLTDPIFPSEFSNKVKAAKERKSTAMDNMGSKVGLGSMGKSPKELPAPPSKAIVDQYGLGKKVK